MNSILSLWRAFARYFLIILSITSLQFGLKAQCLNSIAYPVNFLDAPTSGNSTYISSCNFAGEYNGIGGITGGMTYTVASDSVNDFITIREGSFDGPVIATGSNPIIFTAYNPGTIFIHWNTDGLCGTDSNCRQTTITAVYAACALGAFSQSVSAPAPGSEIMTNAVNDGDYVELIDLQQYQPYLIASQCTTQFITLMDVNEVPIAAGYSPLSYVPAFDQDIYVILNDDENCIADGGSCPLIIGATMLGCGDMFTDSNVGGDYDLTAYEGNEAYTVTICPDSPGTDIQLVFGFFETELNYDYMLVHNGPTVSSNLIPSAYVNPGFGSAPDFSWNGTGAFAPGSFVSTHPSGCLTIEFYSDGSVEYAGWEAQINCGTPCSGTPAPGATLSTLSSVCPLEEFTLSIANNVGSGVNYLWQRSANGTAPWTNIGSSISAITSQSAQRVYRCRVTCIASGITAISTPITIGMNAPTACYVPNPADFEFDTYISEVSINDTISSSSCDFLAPGPNSLVARYSNYLTEDPISGLIIGGVNDFYVDVSDCEQDFGYQSDVAIYIDFNQDGDFEDEGEEVFESSDLNFPDAPTWTYTQSGSFVVPPGALPGITGMRVIATEDGGGGGKGGGDIAPDNQNRGFVGGMDITPTMSYSYGETEDYLVYMIPGLANDLKQFATQISTTPYPSCNSPRTVNLADASDSFETETDRVDAWYTFFAVTDAVRIQLTGASNMDIELHDALGWLATEDDVVANGNETMIYSGLTPGVQYWVALQSVGLALPGQATVCVSHFRRSTCDNPTTFSTPCGIYKSDWTGANTYTVYFDDDGALPYVATGVSTGGITYVQLRNLVGLPPMTTTTNYLVRVDATYNVFDAAGNPETVIVQGTFSCTRTLNPHPDIVLRTNDASPNVRPANAIIGVNTWLCGALYYRWTYQRYDAIGGSPVEVLPSVVNGPPTSRFINLYPLALVPNGIYKVFVTPVFPTGDGITGSDRWLLIAGPAGSVLELNPSNEPGYARSGSTTEVESSIYPNPSNGEGVNISISGVDTRVQIRILDGVGRTVYTNNLIVEGALTTQISFARPLAAGLYTVELSFDGNVLTERLMVLK